MNFEDLTFLFSCDNRNRGILRMNFDEAALLFLTVRQSSGNILEIGRYNGGSTVLISKAMGEGRKLVSLDLHMNLDPVALAHLAGNQNVKLMQCNSREFNSNKMAFGMILFDGDHTHEGLRADVKKHWNNLIIGGYAVFHDAVPNTGLLYEGKVNHCAGVATVTKEMELCYFGKPIENSGSLLVMKKAFHIEKGF